MNQLVAPSAFRPSARSSRGPRFYSRTYSGIIPFAGNPESRRAKILINILTATSSRSLILDSFGRLTCSEMSNARKITKLNDEQELETRLKIDDIVILPNAWKRRIRDTRKRTRGSRMDEKFFGTNDSFISLGPRRR